MAGIWVEILIAVRVAAKCSALLAMLALDYCEISKIVRNHANIDIEKLQSSLEINGSIE